MSEDKIINGNQEIGLDSIMSQLVLQRPWNGGYGEFDSVTAMDVHNEVPRPPRNQPQIGFDPKRNALTIMAGIYTVYDDNGFFDGGWDILPDAQRLAIPLSVLVNLVRNRRFGEVTVPSELTEQSGKRTFDYTPKSEQYAALENMEELDETVLPRSFGNISCKFSYGTLRLTLVPREDNKIGLIAGEYVPIIGVTNQRDTNFFTNRKDELANKVPELKKYIVFYSERSAGPQCNDDKTLLVESPILPTQELLRVNGMISSGACTNVSYPGCEDCGGSAITAFRVEDYSIERVEQLELANKSEGDAFHLGNQIQRYFRKDVVRLMPK